MLDPLLATAIAALFGLCVGSFLNVVIHRLPKMLERGWQAQCAELRGENPTPGPVYNLVVPRSACPACSAPITALQNIPVVSWLVLRGTKTLALRMAQPRTDCRRAIRPCLATKGRL